MASLREILSRWFDDGEPHNSISHVTDDAVTIVDSRKLFQQPHVRKLFDSMKERKNGVRQVVVTGKR